MKLIRRVQWGYVELHWWNWLGFFLAFLGCAAVYWLTENRADLRLTLGAWLDPIFWTTLLLTMAAISVGSLWTTRP
jgi:hypothetical protein